MNRQMITPKSLRVFFLSLIPSTALMMVVLSGVDLQWTEFLRRFSDYSWVRWMDQSVFEGGFLGAGDITLAVYFGVICLFFYRILGTRSFSQRSGNNPEGYQLLGRILVAGFLVLFLTHGFKWLMGRPRPVDFFAGSCDFKTWFEVSSEGLCSRRYRGGSFPSGHTSNAASLIFPLAAWAQNQRRRPLLLFTLCCAGVFAYALVMGLARIMHGDHWVTDIWGAFCINLYVFILLWKPWHLVGTTQDGD